MNDPKVYVDVTRSSMRTMLCDVLFKCPATLAGNAIDWWFMERRVLQKAR